MGLSSKQVSVDGLVLDWGHGLLQPGALDLSKPPQSPQVRQEQQQEQQQQQSTPLKCPRCDSTNTKFCYYNNYNRSQPRHFCKACRRHWTKGGTLRNVPVGGGRKNKRLKTTHNTTTTTTTTAAGKAANPTTSTSGRVSRNTTNNMAIQAQQQLQLQQQQHLPLPFGDSRSISDILYQSLLHPPTSSSLPLSPQQDYTNKVSSNDDGEIINISSDSLLGSPLSLPPNPIFPFTSLSSFVDNPTSMSSFTCGFQPSDVYNSYTGEAETAEDSTITTTTITTTNTTTIGFMDSTSYWSWDDLTSLITTDVKQPWDDSLQ
uniref:Dof zinc finger protein n=1 Tax=Nelumbo nucifera TaxID=4432 RepID=A0A822XKK0_NELNU|nr:TPA_asm: hypothetical protein HUJ06_022343 [Nelumbo nucifera]